MLYLSHKGVHSDFVPAARDRGRAGSSRFKPPLSIQKERLSGTPTWVKNQRNSWHGMDFPYHSTLDIEEYYKRYAETLYGVDASVGRVMDYLRENDLLKNTLVIYMGDNGFAFGEHGLIDKRTAYEESMRVPMLAYGPGLIKPGTRVDETIANIDIAAALLECAGLMAPSYMDGSSFYALLQGKKVAGWRNALLYEYYWERNFPQTPTIHAIRTDRYKYIHYHGIWDVDEFYDLQTDPLEMNNLIDDTSHREKIKEMNTILFERLKQTQGLYIPIYPDRGNQYNLRNATGDQAADFPEQLKHHQKK